MPKAIFANEQDGFFLYLLSHSGFDSSLRTTRSYPLPPTFDEFHHHWDQ